MKFKSIAVALVVTIAPFALRAQTNNTEAAPPPSMPANPVATPAAPAEQKAPTPPAETPIKAKRTAPKALDQKGQISKIDVTAGTFVVGDLTFNLSRKPRIEVDGDFKTLADIREGDKVAVVYFARSDGKNTATRVIKGNAAHRTRKSKS